MNLAYAAADTAQKVSIDFSATEAMLQATLPVQLTLLILIGLSVVCWAVIFTKKKYLDSVHSANEKFLELFAKATSLDDVFEDLDKHLTSPLGRIFRAGYGEMKKIAKIQMEGAEKGAKPLLSGIDNLERALRRNTDIEISNMESRLSLLATTGSTGPFIGLFGTVWGIMGSFHKIGSTGVANLATVAPGISEALIATAIGLAAAIPATVAYNHFVTRIRREEIDLNSFAADFINIAKRNFFKE